ncbi:MAG: nuclear transport factor 2 family protein [Rhodocyclaceae bacterium]|jgi:ketosteroid isomerase-like protein|nr:nuclear transport factor 2 family protein [Rhodocyclaceae bacterium]
MSKPIYTTPVEAEAAFYDALSRSDLEGMMAVWSEDDEVYCVHPGGPRIAGLAAIRESWRQIFAAGQRLEIRLSHQTAIANMMMAAHSLMEHIALAGEDLHQPPVLATNIFTRGAHGWRIVAHHASPLAEPEDLFADATPRIVH